MEALVGSASNDLFGAIFDVEVNENDYELFDSDMDPDEPELRSRHSRESLKANAGDATPTKGKRDGKNRLESPSPVPSIRTRQPTSSRIPSAQNSPKLQRLTLSNINTDDTVNSDGVKTTTMSTRSPLAKLFGSRLLSASPTIGNFEGNSNGTQVRVAAQVTTNAEASMKQVAALLDSVKELPVQKLKEEMKELQVRVFSNYMWNLGRPLFSSPRIVKRALRICCFC